MKKKKKKIHFKRGCFGTRQFSENHALCLGCPDYKDCKDKRWKIFS